jgi:dephospho-CoA kinase
MFIIGITGGIGCGKSTIASIAAEAGLPVLDADAISREVTDCDGRALPEIREAFGPRAIGPDGGMNRKWIAAMAFRDKQALDRLSAIIHRHVLDILGEQVAFHTENGTKALVMDVPIPVAHGFLDVCDQIWVAWADDSVRIPRLTARGMPLEDARRRIAMQMTRADYEKLADHLILNNGTREELEQTVKPLLAQELGSRGIRLKR